MNKNYLLGKLPPFQNSTKKIVEEQNYSDIENAIINAHYQYEDQYLIIAPFFHKGSFRKSCVYLFQWVVKNLPYKIESSFNQKIKSPAAILATSTNDCKNYSLFIGGVLHALEKLYYPGMKLKYRFGAYSNNKFPDHVYIIAEYKGETIILDAVIKKFDFEEIPYFYKDKKINMALNSVSGVGCRSCGRAYVGNNPLALIDPTGGFLSNLISSIKIRRRGCSSEDWQGWDEQDRKNLQGVGSSVRGYVLRDDRDAACEAANVIAYIQANGLDNLLLNGPAETIPGTAWRNVTIKEIADKLRRGGMPNEANQFEQNFRFNQPLPSLPNRNLSIPASSSFQRTRTTATPGNMFANVPGGSVQNSGGGGGINPLLIAGGLAAALFFFMRKK